MSNFKIKIERKYMYTYFVQNCSKQDQPPLWCESKQARIKSKYINNILRNARDEAREKLLRHRHNHRPTKSLLKTSNPAAS